MLGHGSTWLIWQGVLIVCEEKYPWLMAVLETVSIKSLATENIASFILRLFMLTVSNSEWHDEIVLTRDVCQKIPFGGYDGGGRDAVGFTRSREPAGTKPPAPIRRFFPGWVRSIPQAHRRTRAQMSMKTYVECLHGNIKPVLVCFRHYERCSPCSHYVG